MVTRTRYKNYATDFFEFYTYKLGTPVTSSGRVENRFVLSFDNHVTADYPNWDYKSIIAKGDNATTQLNGVLNFFTGTPHLFGGRAIYETPTRSKPSNSAQANMRLHHPSDPSHNTGLYHLESYGVNYHYLDTFSLDSSTFDSGIDLQARQRFINNLVKTQKKFDSLVFGGELRETVDLILSPGRSLRRALDGHVAGFLKKGAPRRFPSFRSFRQYVQGKWLEFVFGVQPLISDVRDGAEALASSIVDRVPNRKVTSSSTGVLFSRFGGPSFDHILLGSSNFKVHYVQAPFTHGFYSKYFGCVYNPNWENGLTASSLGIDWRNVAPAIYELIPYSFLVDYFTNLGGLINYYSYGTANVKWVNHTSISHDECFWEDYVISPTNLGDNVVDHFDWTPGSARTYFIRRSVSRSPYFGTLYPGIQFGFPSLPQWLNIAALIDSSDKIFHGFLKGVRL